MHLRCPHCRNPIELLDPPELARGDIVCPSCGSSFRLEGDATVSSRPERRRVGRFELIEVVGVGAFGTVYRARDTDLDRTVAVKIPRAGNLGTQEDVDRFLREARSAAQLRHPSIVALHEVGEHDGTPFLVSEYVDGVTLSDWLSARQPSFRESAELLARIAEALEFAHMQGVVHRDVKPSNILLDGENQPHVMDFGLAKRAAGEITMTVDGQVLGTPAYMSPEQAKGEGHQVDGQSDVYSLGVILYLLCTGELPFRGTARMLLHQVIHDEPKPARKLNDRIPRDLETIMSKAMAKEAARRYASAKELAEDLRRFLGNEPIRARPVSGIERGIRWCKRNPALALAGGLAGVALLAVAGVSAAYAMQQARSARDLLSVNTKLDLANTSRKGALESATAERDRTRSLAAELAYSSGQSLLDDQGSAAGLLWLARGLHLVSPDDRDAERLFRTGLGAWTRDVHSLHQPLPTSGFTVMKVGFSPDGTAVLTGGDDGSVRLWRVRDGVPIGAVMKHDGRVTSAVFSPDGRTIATGSMDNTARLWSASDGAPIGNPMTHSKEVNVVAFRPDGKVVATGSSDKTARLWSASDGSPIGQPMTHQNMVPYLSFSPGGELLATGSFDHSARLWNGQDGTPHGPPLSHPNLVGSVEFSPDGKTVLTGCLDGKARLWNVADGSAKGIAMVHPEAIRAAVFSPSGESIVTASHDNTARLWNTVDGTPLGAPMRHAEPIYQVAFSPDGKMLATASGDRTARLWSAQDGTPLGLPMTHEGRVIALAFCPNSQFLATAASERTARVWRIAGAPSPAPIVHGSPQQSAAFSPDGRSLLLVGFGDARLFRVQGGTPVGKPLTHEERIRVAEFSPDGRTVLTASEDKTARLWRVEDGSAIGEAMRHEGHVGAATFSPDGKLVVTGSADRKARVWSATDGSLKATTLSHETPHGEIYAVACSPDGQTFVTGSEDNTARLWRTSDGTPIGVPMRHEQVVRAVAYSDDGRTILTHGWDGTVRFWSAIDAKSIRPPLKLGEAITHVVFSADRSNLLASDGRFTARLWSAAEGVPVGKPMTHSGTIRALAFHPDGQIVLTGGEDNTARFWHAGTGQPIAGRIEPTGNRASDVGFGNSGSGEPIGGRLRHFGDVVNAGFSPDGMMAVTGEVEGAARLWRVPVPVEGDRARIETWIQVITGMELDASNAVRFLDAEEWRERKRQLGE